MRIIKNADTLISKVYGHADVQDCIYRLSTFSLLTEIDDGVLLLSAITGELVFLDSSEVKALHELPCPYAPWMKELAEKHFLVPSNIDEKQDVDSLRLIIRTLQSSKDIFNYIILPTTSCNARCYYCYEAGCSRETMTTETADQLVSFMKANRGNEPLRLVWFGGEPLLCVETINRICKQLRADSIPFSSTIISNAYLFDKETVLNARSCWGLTKIQITLDGSEETYNKIKAFVDTQGSPYTTVLNNINLLLKSDIQVELRLNLGLDNADSLMSLIDELSLRFASHKNLKVYSHYLYNNCGVEPFHYSGNQIDFLLSKGRKINESINKHFPNNRRDNLPKLTATCCMVDKDSVLMVSPTGMLGKCEHYVDSHFVGNLESGITNQEELATIRQYITYPQCPQCPIYPACLKMTLCNSDAPCFDERQREILDTIVSTMKLYYDDFKQGCMSCSTEEDTLSC